MSEPPSTTPGVDGGAPEQEHEFHHYTGNEIPWYVRLIWIGFWIFAVYYTIRYLFPALRVELFQQ